MLQTLDCSRTRSNINQIKKLDTNILAVSTQLHGVRFIDFDECRTISTITHEHLTSDTKAICFSQNAEFMVFASKLYIFILHIPSKIVLKTIKTDGEIVEYLSFDLDSKYIIAATTSGRILQYRYDGSSLLARLYSFERSQLQAKATSFAFYGNTMICGSSNGKLVSINLLSRANKATIHNDNARINALCFLNQSTIASADAKGNIYINSLKNGALIKKIETAFTHVQQILLLPNPNYMIVNSNQKNVAVYDIENFKLLHNKYLDFDTPVTSIILGDNDTLLVALENNSLQKVLLPKADKLKKFIVDNALDKAFALVRKDPLLKGTREYKVLQIAYKKIYKATLDALIKQNHERALALVKMFKYVDSKKDEIQMLFKAFENYPRFKVLYCEKKYALAYAMVTKFPPLSQTFQYKKMEELWEDAFSNAQRQIAHGRVENAVTLLNEYATVTDKRPIIKLILKHNKDFLLFLKAIESNNFKTIDKLAHSNPLFTLIPNYKNVEKSMQLEIESIQKDIQKCNLDAAVKKLSTLQNIPSIAESISLQKDECRAIKKLQDAYEVNNFIACFEVIDVNNFLNSTELGVLLQSHWSKLMSACEIFALKGNVKDIKGTLGELITLKTRRDKIGDLFRLAFHTKIKALVHKKIYKNAESIIYSYLDIFGSDREIFSIMHAYETKSKTMLAITQKTRVPRDAWIQSDAIMGM